MTIEDFIGTKVEYDENGGQYLWGIGKDGSMQMIGQIRAWGAIQNLFKENGVPNLEKAAEFQDELGKWVADAINEKLGLK